ncbi:hypothetical protein CCP2SC5_1910001 [Azospirillaceae bacterium]
MWALREGSSSFKANPLLGILWFEGVYGEIGMRPLAGVAFVFFVDAVRTGIERGRSALREAAVPG